MFSLDLIFKEKKQYILKHIIKLTISDLLVNIQELNNNNI